MTDIKLLTYNIWFDDYHKELRTAHICKIIIENDPEFVALQEVTITSFNIIKKYLSNIYSFSKYKINPNYDTIILSKHKIIDSQTIPFDNSKMGRSIHYIIAKKDDLLIKIINIHLESDFRNNTKYKQLELVFEQMKDQENVIMMGDTNIDKEIEIPNYLKDVWIDDGKKEELMYTYDYQKNDNIVRKFRSRLDRIYTTNVCKIRDMKFVGDRPIIDKIYPSHDTIYPSDHFGLLLSIEV